MKKIMFLVLAGTVVMASCKKKGCTDEKATNYNAEAKKDDGSCVLPVVQVVQKDTEKPIVSYTATTGGTVVEAGQTVTILATATDNESLASWTYRVLNSSGTEVATKITTLAGEKTVSIDEDVVVLASWGTGAFTIAVTALDDEGNESVSLSPLAFIVEDPAAADTEDPKITEILQKYPLTGNQVSNGTKSSNGGKWQISVSDDIEIDEVKITFYSTTNSADIVAKDYTAIGANTWSKEVHLQFDDRALVGSKAKLIVYVKDAAGKETTMEYSVEYEITL